MAHCGGGALASKEKIKINGEECFLVKSLNVFRVVYGTKFIR